METKPTDKLPFPSVTLCNQNKLRWVLGSNCIENALFSRPTYFMPEIFCSGKKLLFPVSIPSLQINSSKYCRTSCNARQRRFVHYWINPERAKLSCHACTFAKIFCSSGVLGFMLLASWHYSLFHDSSAGVGTAASGIAGSLIGKRAASDVAPDADVLFEVAPQLNDMIFKLVEQHFWQNFDGIICASRIFCHVIFHAIHRQQLLFCLFFCFSLCGRVPKKFTRYTRGQTKKQTSAQKCPNTVPLSFRRKTSLN